MMMTKPSRYISTVNPPGYTLIEVVAVLVIFGILAAYVAVTSMNMISSANEQGELNQFETHLKYAQGRAINSNTLWGIRISGGQYGLFRYNLTVPIYYYFPGMEKSLANTFVNCRIPMPTGYTDNVYIWFDLWGRAYKNVIFNPSSASPISKNETILSGKLTIEQHTGYIHGT